MPLIRHSRVGAVAFERLLRDGASTLLAPGYALPRDIVATPGLRALAVRDHVPPHTILSGLAGLWVLTGGEPPTVLDVVGARGLHRAAAAMPCPAGLRVVYHSGRAPAEPQVSVQRLTIANIGRCCIDALRWGDHAVAIPAVTNAVKRGGVSVDALSSAFNADHPRGPGHYRLRSVWRELSPALRRLSATAKTDAATAGRDASSP